MTLSRRNFLRVGAGMAMSAMLPTLPTIARARPLLPSQSVQVIRHGRDDVPRVALTFDDCWFEDATLEIATAFAEKDVRVTFFPAGLAIRANIDNPTPGYENLYRRIYDMGHEFGCHTFTHPDITDLTTHRLIWWEIQPWLDVLNEALDEEIPPTRFFRPPLGIVTDALFDACYQRDMELILWTADLGDLSYPLEDCVDLMADRLETVLEPGAIYLQHATPQSAAFVTRQLEILDEAGIAPVTLSTLLEEGQDAPSANEDET